MRNPWRLFFPKLNRMDSSATPSLQLGWSGPCSAKWILQSTVDSVQCCGILGWVGFDTLSVHRVLELKMDHGYRLGYGFCAVLHHHLDWVGFDALWIYSGRF
jgi:hypothetical protein